MTCSKTTRPMIAMKSFYYLLQCYTVDVMYVHKNIMICTPVMICEYFVPHVVIL